MQIQVEFGSSDNEKINYIKTHKDIKNLVQAHGLQWQKIKYLAKEKQISHVQGLLDNIVLKNSDRNTVIDFLTSDYQICQNDATEIISPVKSLAKKDDGRRDSFQKQKRMIDTYTGKYDESNPLQNFLVQETDSIPVAPLIESQMDFDDTPIRTDSYKEISDSLMTDPGPI